MKQLNIKVSGGLEGDFVVIEERGEGEFVIVREPEESLRPYASATARES